jgi:hypothetical protein
VAFRHVLLPQTLVYAMIALEPIAPLVRSSLQTPFRAARWKISMSPAGMRPFLSACAASSI